MKLLLILASYLTIAAALPDSYLNDLNYSDDTDYQVFPRIRRNPKFGKKKVIIIQKKFYKRDINDDFYKNSKTNYDEIERKRIERQTDPKKHILQAAEKQKDLQEVVFDNLDEFIAGPDATVAPDEFPYDKASTPVLAPDDEGERVYGSRPERQTEDDGDSSYDYDDYYQSRVERQTDTREQFLKAANSSKILKGIVFDNLGSFLSGENATVAPEEFPYHLAVTPRKVPDDEGEGGYGSRPQRASKNYKETFDLTIAKNLEELPNEEIVDNPSYDISDYVPEDTRIVYRNIIEAEESKDNSNNDQVEEDQEPSVTAVPVDSVSAKKNHPDFSINARNPVHPGGKGIPFLVRSSRPRWESNENLESEAPTTADIDSFVDYKKAKRENRHFVSDIMSGALALAESAAAGSSSTIGSLGQNFEETGNNFAKDAQTHLQQLNKQQYLSQLYRKSSQKQAGQFFMNNAQNQFQHQHQHHHQHQQQYQHYPRGFIRSSRNQPRFFSEVANEALATAGSAAAGATSAIGSLGKGFEETGNILAANAQNHLQQLSHNRGFEQVVNNFANNAHAQLEHQSLNQNFQRRYRRSLKYQPRFFSEIANGALATAGSAAAGAASAIGSVGKEFAQTGNVLAASTQNHLQQLSHNRGFEQNVNNFAHNAHNQFEHQSFNQNFPRRYRRSLRYKPRFFSEIANGALATAGSAVAGAASATGSVGKEFVQTGNILAANTQNHLQQLSHNRGFEQSVNNFAHNAHAQFEHQSLNQNFPRHYRRSLKYQPRFFSQIANGALATAGSAAAGAASAIGSVGKDFAQTGNILAANAQNHLQQLSHNRGFEQNVNNFAHNAHAQFEHQSTYQNFPRRYKRSLRHQPRFFSEIANGALATAGSAFAGASSAIGSVTNDFQKTGDILAANSQSHLQNLKQQNYDIRYRQKGSDLATSGIDPLQNEFVNSAGYESAGTQNHLDAIERSARLPRGIPRSGILSNLDGAGVTDFSKIKTGIPVSDHIVSYVHFGPVKTNLGRENYQRYRHRPLIHSYTNIGALSPVGTGLMTPHNYMGHMGGHYGTNAFMSQYHHTRLYRSAPSSGQRNADFHPSAVENRKNHAGTTK